MPNLSFRITDVDIIVPAATPQLAFHLRIDDLDGDPAPLQSVLLRAQVRIQPTARDYSAKTEPGLVDLFGQRERWGATMRSLLWTHVNLIVPPFERSTAVELPVECTYDFNVAATKYFSSLDDGYVPLCFLFSGTYFYQTERGLQAGQISWEREANFQLPVSVWKQLMDSHYSHQAWLCLDKDVFDRLYEFKILQAMPTWDRTVDSLLEHSDLRTAVEE